MLSILSFAGVGKGTFAARVAKKLAIPAISTGDIIRAEIKAGSDLGKEIKKYSDSGKLVPDGVVVAMVQKRLKEADAQNGYILDGFPRTVEQAQALDKLQKVSRVLNITLPEHVLMAKMLARRVCADCGKGYNVANIKEGDLDMPPLLPKPSDCDKCHGKPNLVIRDDDKEDVVKERMIIYHKQTAPLIDYYGKQGKLSEFHVKKGLDDTPRLFDFLGC
jgi:adenylate kinase